MQAKKVIEGSFVYTRVSKSLARKLWGKQPVVFCPVKLKPGIPYMFHSVFCAEEVRRKKLEFEHIVSDFTYYNCCGKTGNYIAFYTAEKANGEKVNGCDLAC